MGLPLGRKNCILLGNGCVIIGGSLQASAWSVAQIIVGRVLCVSTYVSKDILNKWLIINRALGSE